MKEVKLKTRIKKSFDAFFDEDHAGEKGALDFAGERAFFEVKPERLTGSKISPARAAENRSWAGFLKQALLFFPGTFVLYFMSMGACIALPRVLADLSWDLFYFPGFYVFLLIGLLAAFLTWLGLGDLKNRKHLVIPASIAAAGGLIGTLVGLTDSFFWLSRKIGEDFAYAICFFPIGLIVPFLAKGWVDKRTEKSKKSNESEF